MLSTKILETLKGKAAETEETVDALLQRLLSRVDVDPDFSSASAIAKDDRWNIWAEKMFVNSPSLMSEFVETLHIRELAQKTIYPSALQDPSSFDDLEGEFAIADRFVNNIRDWSTSVSPHSWSASPSLEVLAFFVPWLMSVNALNGEAPELAQRSLADAVIMMAFSERKTDDRKHIVSFEQSVNLPVGADSPYKVMNTVANVIVSWDLGSELLNQIQEYCNANGLKRRLFEWINFPDQDKMTIGTFFAEWKKEDILAVRRQGVYDSLAIQSHRRVLGLRDRPVYGAIMNNGIIYLMVSYWRGKSLRTHYTDVNLSWDIRQPGKVVEFYYFLCNLKRHIDEGQINDLETFDVNRINTEYVKECTENWEAALKSRQSKQSSRKKKRKRSGTGREEEGGEPRDANGVNDVVNGVQRSEQSNANANKDNMDNSTGNSSFDSISSANKDDTDDSDGDSSSDSVSSRNATPTKTDVFDKIYSIVKWRQGEESWVREVDNFGQIREIAQARPSQP